MQDSVEIWVYDDDALPIDGIDDAIAELMVWEDKQYSGLMVALGADRRPLFAVPEPSEAILFHPHSLGVPGDEHEHPAFALMFTSCEVEDVPCEDCLQDFRSWRNHLAANGTVALDWIHSDGENFRSLAFTNSADAWGDTAAM